MQINIQKRNLKNVHDEKAFLLRSRSDLREKGGSQFKRINNILDFVTSKHVTLREKIVAIFCEEGLTIGAVIAANEKV